MIENSQQRRMTRQRQVLLEELCKLRTHPTADELYLLVKKRLPRVSLGTVYRNLELLTGDGKIRTIDHGGMPRRYDGDVKPHLHVQCTKCNRLVDVMEVELPTQLDDIKVPGWTITGQEVIIQGICDRCQGS